MHHVLLIYGFIFLFSSIFLGWIAAGISKRAWLGWVVGLAALLYLTNFVVIGD